MSETFNPRRFRSTVPFYARYRLGYPDSLIARVAEFVGLRTGDAVMDLGCGPGFLAVPFAKLGMSVVAVDPEPGMVNACREASAEAGVRVDVRQGSSFALPDGVGPFRLVTMGRSFHWMDREATLKTLDRMVTRDGALAFFNDEHPRTAENTWRRKLEEVAGGYGRHDAAHVRERRREGHRTVHSLLLESAFARVSGLSEFVRREITADEIVGRAFSLSATSPQVLGERAPAFEAEMRKALAELSVDGRFVEIAELSALVARR
ncbi:MAG: methyltransferase domain-containing protein [Alphaproteobacteria bacterium]|nr:methyltransferase domain-containing protein [Alphaproteobacteria bacterium]MBL6939711.1 methyltransferase domain-containing protein [Alphaproteobacteria bacterium]MBL7096967.1 methyltransferase domain-containing protein [Alphaproteobacteria bacterium]